MSEYIIGLDTGGTFTDSALIERKTGEVIATAKVLTTHHKLPACTSEAIAILVKKASISTTDIHAIAVSTTLATNAVVEKKGCRVALFVIGYVKHFKLPVKAVLFVKGGHTITGKEEEPLDLEYLLSLLPRLREEVDAYAICSAMSFTNPTHELVTHRAITMLDPKPVFCSHQISCQAGMKERAATAALHAKLMPLMHSFIDSIAESLANQKICSPLHIITGDGHPLPASETPQQAAMTVASGPACTAFFGSMVTDNSAIIVDIGGTTTDITMVEEGKPLMQEDGCHIDDWPTHVRAVNMLTRGIGGDSLVIVSQRGEVHIGPSRVTPLCMASQLPDPRTWLGYENDGVCVQLSKEVKDITDEEPIVQILSRENFCTHARLQELTGFSGIPLIKQLERLYREAAIKEFGFTPTDALHVLGSMHFGNNEKSWEAAEHLGRKIGLTGHELSTRVEQRTLEYIENSILEYLTQRYWQNELTRFISTRDKHPVLNVSFSLNIPIIGIGAAAKYFLPRVAEHLGTTVIFPENCEVGNAIGAAYAFQHRIFG